MTPAGAVVRLLAIAMLAAAPLFLGDARTYLLTEILIFGLFAASLDLVMGFGGMPSLGHAAYFGVGAYAAALTALHVTPNVLVQIGVAAGAAVLAAVATGVLAVRSRGIYFLMLTLAFGELLFQLALNWDSVTQGSDGLYGVPNGSFYPGDNQPLDAFAYPTRFYFYVLGAFLIGYGVLRLVVASPFGRALVGARENEARMSSLGYSVPLYRLGAFCIAGAVAGFAGALTIEQQKYASPSNFAFAEVSALAVIALIVGGQGTLLGPVLGAAFVYVVRDELASYWSEHWMIALGGILVLVVYLLPGGFVGAARAARARFRPRREVDDVAAAGVTP
jgi:branched-chain amino acid transport system permease protein